MRPGRPAGSLPPRWSLHLADRACALRVRPGAWTFCLKSVHPGHTADEVRDRTGFSFDEGEPVAATPQPDGASLSLLRGRVLDELAESYPQFAEGMKADLRQLVERNCEGATNSARNG